MLRKVSRNFGVNRSSLKPFVPRATRSDAHPDGTREAVESFLQSAATQLPDKKHVSKKTMTAKAFLDRPMADLYKDFKLAQPNIKLGLSKFCSYQPVHIQVQSKNKMRQCLCEYCTDYFKINFNFKNLT